MSMETLKQYNIELSVIDGIGGGMGSVSRSNREPGLEVAEESLDKLESKLKSGEYLVECDSTDIGQCGDGRPGDFIAMKMFGGTPALARDDAMSANNRYYESGGDVTVAQTKLYEDRANHGKQSFIHTDDHSEMGCGECAKAGQAAELIHQSRDAVLEVSQAYFEKTGLGVIDKQIANEVIENTQRLIGEGFYADGKKQLDNFRTSDFTEASHEEVVRGDHLEAAYIVLINESDKPVTIDRDKIAQDFTDEHIQVFVENHTEIMKELAEISKDEESYSKLVTANVMRRMATAATLTDLSQRVIFMTVHGR